MPDPTTVEEAIEDAAIGQTKKAKEENREVENYDLAALIDADRYLKGGTARRKPHRGLYLTKCIPPGAG